jgi:CPA1 family monovalent cation:H+ antiporter
MGLFDVIAILITLSAVFSWINHRFLKMPTAIGLMLIALLVSLALLVTPGHTAIQIDAERMLESIDFDATLLHGMLSFLLFAGALHVNLFDLAKQKWVIATLATAGVLGSTFIVGGGVFVLFWLLGLDVPLIYCLLFGALISPTDPIAVLGILKSARAPKSLEVKITGESLFNDGVAVVTFMVLAEIAFGASLSPCRGCWNCSCKEAFGGLLFGLVSGGIAYLMLRRVDNYQVEVLITLALASGSYAAGGGAAPLRAHHRRRRRPADRQPGPQRRHVATDPGASGQLLGASGRGAERGAVRADRARGPGADPERRVHHRRPPRHPAGAAARAVSAGLPIALMRRFRSFSTGVVTILTWGGLRGGISVALALSLPTGETRDLLVTVTYMRCGVLDPGAGAHPGARGSHDGRARRGGDGAHRVAGPRRG